MAERFAETVNIQTQDLRTGAVQGALSLADRLEGFRTRSLKVAQDQAVKRGVESAQQTELEKVDVNGRQVTKAPTKKPDRFIGSIEVNAHNKALSAAYITSLDSDNRNAIAEITANNKDDLLKFNDAIEGYRKGVIENVDPSARQLVEIDLNDKITSARIGVQEASIEKQNKQADEALKLGVERSGQDALTLASQGQALDSAQSLLTAFATIDSRVEAGMLDPSVAVEQKRKLEVAATVESVRFTMSQTIAEKGIQKAVDLINLAEDKPLSGFNVAEQDSLVTTLKSDLNQFMTLENIAEKQEEEGLKERQESNFSELYIGVLQGEVNAADVQSALGQKAIDSGQAIKLGTIFNTRGQGVNDFSLIRFVQEQTGKDPANARAIIKANTGSRLTEKTANELYTKTFEEEKADSLLKTEKSKRFKSFLNNSVKVVGALGAIDFDSQKRLANLSVVYDERVLDGEDPAIVARDLVDVNAFLTAPSPLFGTKEDLKGSLIELDSAFDAQTISDEDYNREFQKLQDLMQQKTNIDGFNKALVEAFK